MEWGCFSADGTSGPHIIEGCVNGKKYQDILDKNTCFHLPDDGPGNLAVTESNMNSSTSAWLSSTQLCFKAFLLGDSISLYFFF